MGEDELTRNSLSPCPRPYLDSAPGSWRSRTQRGVVSSVVKRTLPREGSGYSPCVLKLRGKNTWGPLAIKGQLFFLGGPCDSQTIKDCVDQVVGALHEECSRKKNKVRKILGFETLLSRGPLFHWINVKTEVPRPGLMVKSHYISGGLEFRDPPTSASAEIKGTHSHPYWKLNPGYQ